MSGSSLDYLCFQDCVGYKDLWKFERVRELLEESNLQSTSLYYNIVKICEALTTTHTLFSGMKENARCNPLHDAEWYFSGDYGKDQFLEGIARFNARFGDFPVIRSIDNDLYAVIDSGNNTLATFGSEDEANKYVSDIVKQSMHE